MLIPKTAESLGFDSKYAFSMLHRKVRFRSSLLSIHDQSLLAFSVFASHPGITSYALKQLFKADSCKQTLVDLPPSYLQLRKV